MKRAIPKVFITFLLICCALFTQGQITPGDLVFTGYNSYDDDIDGSTRNDVFSFVLLKNCPANTVIYFTDLGRTSSGFQSLNCGAGDGSNTDGVIRWTAPAGGLLAGKQVVIKCKYNPAAVAAAMGTVTPITPTKNSASATQKEYISLGLAGDQLFAYTTSDANGNPAAVHTVIAGINVNRTFWDASLGACDLTSSLSVSPTVTATLKMPSIPAVNGRYNCLRLIGTSAVLRGLITNPDQWLTDNTYSTTFPASFNLLTTPPCDLTIVNPDAQGVVRVDNSTATPGDGTTWVNPVKELRDALVAAADPASGIKEIWVAKGIYYASGSQDVNASFVVPTGVKVYGGFKGGASGETALNQRTPAQYPVVLSGDLDNDDVNKTGGVTLTGVDLRGNNTKQLVVIPALANNVVLDNLVITGAYNPGGNGAAVTSAAGSVGMGYLISNCRLQGNQAAQGSAVYLPDASGYTATITGSLITGNYGYALSATGVNTIVLKNTTVARNDKATNINAATFSADNTIISTNITFDVMISGSTPQYRNTLVKTDFYNNAQVIDPALGGTALFKNPAAGDFRLDTSNKIINQGSNALTTLTTDLDGNPRISNVTVDPGAYEYQALVQTVTFAPTVTSFVYGTVDAAFTPAATTNGGGAISITSSAPAIALINNNTLTAKGAGTATLTVKAAATRGYLESAPVTVSVTVTPRPLSVTADDVTRAYGQPNPAVPALTWSGFAFADGPSIFSPATTVDYAGTTTTSAPGEYPISPKMNGATNPNYQVVTTNGKLTITQATQTITTPGAITKTYGDAPFDPGATASSGLGVTYTIISGPATVSGQLITITGAGTVEVGVSQAGNTNYQPANATFNFTVNKAVVNITANNASRPYNEANPAFTYTMGALVNGDNPSVITGQPVLATTATMTSDAGTYDIIPAVGTLQAANYTFNFVKGTLTITRQAQTISFNNLVARTYGDAPFDLDITASSGLPVTLSVSGPATISNSTLTVTGAGIVSITATQAGNGNYQPVTKSQGLVIQPAGLKVIADDKWKYYNEPTAALTYHFNGFVYNETAAVISGQPALSTSVTAASPLGTYPINITANTLSSPNYTFIMVPGTYTVGKGTQTITFNNPPALTYGALPVALNASSNSGLPVSFRVVSGPATISGNQLTVTGAGSVTVEASQEGDASWDPAAPVSRTFTVAKATATISVGNYSRKYAEADPAFTYTVTGLVNNDPATVITGAPVITPVSDASSGVGVYDVNVTIGTLQAVNYDFNLVKGSLTISPNNQQITFAPLVNKTYGDPAITLNATASSGLPVSYTVSGPAAINGNQLTITGAGNITVTATQAGNTNWLAATPAAQQFTVAKAALTVTADNKQRAYGVANPALTYTITGFVNNENAAVLTGTPALSTTAGLNSAVGAYPITVAVNTLTAANYSFTLADGVLTISQAGQSISFPQPADKTYGDAPFTLNATSSSGLPVAYSVQSGPATISNNSITITGAGTVTIAANQAGDGNFTAAAEVVRSFAVNKAAITVTARNAEKTYDGQPYNGGNGVDVSGLVNNDQPAVIGTVTYTGSSQGAVNSGTYDLLPQVGPNGNYTITPVAGSLTIKKAKQTITFQAIGNKNEGDPQFTLQATASSGLPVSFASDKPGVISISGNTATVVAAGVAVITASQAGNNNYEAADAVAQTVTVTAYPVPDVTPNGPLDFCEQGSVTLAASAAPAYAWAKDGARIPGATTASYKATSSGTYQVYAIYPGNQEKASVPVTVTVYPLPVVTVTAGSPTTISKGETITLMASGGGTYAWQPAAGLSNVTGAVTNARPSATTEYKVQVTSDKGCVATGAITITVKEDYKLEGTNLLTPNGDGRNDYWIVKNIDMYPDNEVKIFDRAGRMVFQQRSYANKWNGTVNGHALAEGTYYYIIDLGPGKPQFKGFITIIHD